MEHYVGLDVSLKQTSICVVNQVGSVVREGVVDSEPEAIAAFVRSKAPGAVRIGLEKRSAQGLQAECRRHGGVQKNFPARVAEVRAKLAPGGTPHLMTGIRQLR